MGHKQILNSYAKRARTASAIKECNEFPKTLNALGICYLFSLTQLVLRPVTCVCALVVQRANFVHKLGRNLSFSKAWKQRWRGREAFKRQVSLFHPLAVFQSKLATSSLAHGYRALMRVCVDIASSSRVRNSATFNNWLRAPSFPACLGERIAARCLGSRAFPAEGCLHA